MWLRGHVYMLPGAVGGSRHSTRERRGIGNHLVDGSLAIDQNTEFPQSTALLRLGEGLVRCILTNDPLVQGKVLDVTLHFNVLLALIVFSQVPGPAKGSRFHSAVHGFPALAHITIKALDFPRTLEQTGRPSLCLLAIIVGVDGDDVPIVMILRIICVLKPLIFVRVDLKLLNLVIVLYNSVSTMA